MIRIWESTLTFNEIFVLKKFQFLYMYLSFEKGQMENEANENNRCDQKQEKEGSDQLVVLVSAWQILYLVGDEPNGADSHGDQMEESVGPRELRRYRQNRSG